MSARNTLEGKRRRRAAKAARRTPPVRLDLDRYIAQHWPLTRRQAAIKRLEGKVYVNGEMVAYPHVERKGILVDELGRLRVMVEGYADPRPPARGLLLR